MGEPLEKKLLFASVSGTDTFPTKEIKYKNILVGESFENFRLLSSVALPSLDILIRPRAEKK